MTDTPRVRLDDLRRFAKGLACGVGVAAARASALASHLLWFDAAGAAPFGIATLPGLLERLDAGAIDPVASGGVVAERAGTAVFDGDRGIPLLVLDRAAGVAAEKAREIGVGLVRVVNVAAPGPGAGVAAELAVGPFVGAVLGPGASWAVALPAGGGLPAVYDPALAGTLADGAKPRRGPGAAPPRGAAEPPFGPLLRVLAPGDGCLVAALAVAALEDLAAFHGRVAGAVDGLDESGGRLLPGPWEERRLAAREHGVAVAPEAWAALHAWSTRLGVPPPEPIATAPPTRRSS